MTQPHLRIQIHDFPEEDQPGDTGTSFLLSLRGGCPSTAKPTCCAQGCPCELAEASTASKSPACFLPVAAQRVESSARPHRVT